MENVQGEQLYNIIRKADKIIAEVETIQALVLVVVIGTGTGIYWHWYWYW